jgi:chitin synthase
MSTTNILALSHQTSFSDTFIALDNLNQAVDSNQMQAETPLLKVVLHIEVASPQLFPSKDATNDYRRNDPEFLFLDYTAVLEAQNGGDERREIEDFPKQHYLKVCSRPVKIALVITMYNEDVHLFVKSIKAVHENIVYLCDKLGADFWKSFVVVIISDGMKQIDPKVKLALEVMGLFDESVALPQRDNYPVAAHLFQRTTNLIINEDLEVEYKAVPMQCIFLLKQRNARKINSHRYCT